MPATILIASPEHLPLLKERKDLGETIAFADTDARRALDVITRQPPNVIALERVFAGTSRGAALINRIKADPALTHCEIRIVAHDSNYVRVSPRRAGEAGPGPVAAAPALAVAEAPSTGVAPLDRRGTRRAPRVDIVDGVEAQVDGNPASVLNLSLVGVQVVSTIILKPNQHVRVTLGGPRQPIRVRSAVAWALFEMSRGVPHYRADIEFFDADQNAVARFIEANKR